MAYGQLFDKAGDQEQRSLKKLGMRWKVGFGVPYLPALTLTSTCSQEYEKQGKWASDAPDNWLIDCSGF